MSFVDPSKALASGKIIDPTSLAIGKKHVTHKKAVCRWCGGPFLQVYGYLWLCLNAECATRQLRQAMRWPDEYDGPLRYIGRARMESPYCWLPLPSQVEFEESRFPNVLFGGAAGGSKSSGLRWHLYRWCQDVPGYESILFRRTFPELERTHIKKMLKEAVIFGAKMTGDRKRNMEWPNGSFILGAHCQDEKDMEKYLSTEYDEIAIDEATTLGERQTIEIASRSRSEATRPEVRERGGGWLRAASNPGGDSHVYYLEHYVEKNPDPEEYEKYHPEHYQFIHAGIDDNPYLEEDYEEKRLDGLTKERYAQLRNGDWSVFSGQFFSRFHELTHIQRIEPS